MKQVVIKVESTMSSTKFQFQIRPESDILCCLWLHRLELEADGSVPGDSIQTPVETGPMPGEIPPNFHASNSVPTSSTKFQ